MKGKSRARSFKDFVLPHRGNAFKPHALRAGMVIAVLGFIALVQLWYVFDTKVALTQSSLLASVLPSVLTSYTNEDRAALKLPELTPDPLLQKAAQLKAEDMAAKGYFAHTAPDGKTPWYWLDQVNYPYSYAGENLAIDFVDSKEVEDAWMASPAHRANIVKPQYTRIGIGTARGMYEGRETTFVVQYFATPKKGALIPNEGVALATTTHAQVLGAEIGPATAAELMHRIAMSPLHTVFYILGAIAIIFGILLFIAIVVHARIQFFEIICGGLLIVGAALGLVAWNALTDKATLPDTSHTAASIEK